MNNGNSLSLWCLRIDGRKLKLEIVDFLCAFIETYRDEICAQLLIKLYA